MTLINRCLSPDSHVTLNSENQSYRHITLATAVTTILNLFDSNKPYALSTHNQKCGNKIRVIFGEALRIRVKNFRQNLPENYSKSTKIAITASNFSKFFQGSTPPNPLRAFHVSRSASCLFCRKKKCLKKMWKLCPPISLIFHYATVFMFTCMCIFTVFFSNVGLFNE